MEVYRYTNGNLNYNTNLIEATPRWSRYSVEFPSAHPTRHQENNTVKGEYFHPYGVQNAPLAILVHGMGDYGAIPCKFLARSLVKKGIACFVVYQIFHSSRIAPEVKTRLYELSPEEWSESYQISVIDVRQVIDWANHIPEINKERIAAVGISFGGFISAITMGIDERVKAGVLIVTGGNTPKIAFKGSRRYMKKPYDEAQYDASCRQYTQYLAEVAEKGLENVTPPQPSFLNDPLTFAPLLRQRPLLMINALWDEAIPKEATLDLWQACDRPPIAWFPANHAGIWLWYPLITRKITRFLNNTFASLK